jgi:hypothetical protein
MKRITTNTQARQRVAQLLADNTAARETLERVCNNPDRWARLNAQAATQGLSALEFDSLCGKMLRTRREWTHLPTPAAREIAAFHGLLITLGSAPSSADEDALKHASGASIQHPASSV